MRAPSIGFVIASQSQVEALPDGCQLRLVVWETVGLA